MRVSDIGHGWSTGRGMGRDCRRQTVWEEHGKGTGRPRGTGRGRGRERAGRPDKLWPAPAFAIRAGIGAVIGVGIRAAIGGVIGVRIDKRKARAKPRQSRARANPRRERGRARRRRPFLARQRPGRLHRVRTRALFVRKTRDGKRARNGTPGARGTGHVARGERARSARGRGKRPRVQRCSSIRQLPKVFGFTRSRSRNSATPSSGERSSSL